MIPSFVPRMCYCDWKNEENTRHVVNGIVQRIPCSYCTQRELQAKHLEKTPNKLLEDSTGEAPIRYYSTFKDFINFRDL